MMELFGRFIVDLSDPEYHSKFGNVFKGREKSGEKRKVLVRDLTHGPTREDMKKAIGRINRNVEENTIDVHINLSKLLYFGNITSPDERNLYFLETFPQNLEQYVQLEPNFERKTSIVQDCCRGMSYLHSYNPPVIHRLLSPRNILIDRRNPEKPIAKISDYFLAEIFKNTSIWQNMSSGVKNTTDKYFAPPEYFTDKIIPQNCSQGYDIFTLGAIFHALLTWTSTCSDFAPILIEKETCIGKYIKEYGAENKKLELFRSKKHSSEMTALEDVITKMLPLYPQDRLPLDKVLKKMHLAKTGTVKNEEIEQESHLYDEQGIQQICHKFLEVLKIEGSMKQTDDVVIATFQALSPEEMKQVLKFGSIQNFLLHHARDDIDLEGEYMVLKNSVTDTSTSDEDENDIILRYRQIHKKLTEDPALESKIGSIFPDVEKEIICISVIVDEQSVDDQEKEIADVKEQLKEFRGLEFEIHKVLPSELADDYRAPKILPCFGPGSMLAQDHRLEQFNEVHRQKRNASCPIGAFADKIYGSLGCVVENNTNQSKEYYALSVKHIINTRENNQSNPIECDNNITMITGIRDSHRIKVPALISPNLFEAFIEDCVYIGKGFYGILEEKRDQGNPRTQGKLIDVALFGPFSESLLSIHVAENELKNKLEIYKEDPSMLHGKVVQKVGAATEFTTGIVINPNYTYSVEVMGLDGISKTIQGKTFLVTSYNTRDKRAEVIGKFGAKGDSGSVVVLKKHSHKAVGMIHGLLPEYPQGGITYKNVMVCVRLDHCIDVLVQRSNLKFEHENLSYYLHYFKPILCLGDQNLEERMKEVENLVSRSDPSQHIDNPELLPTSDQLCSACFEKVKKPE